EALNELRSASTRRAQELRALDNQEAELNRIQNQILVLEAQGGNADRIASLQAEAQTIFESMGMSPREAAQATITMPALMQGDAPAPLVSETAWNNAAPVRNSRLASPSANPNVDPRIAEQNAAVGQWATDVMTRVPEMARNTAGQIGDTIGLSTALGLFGRTAEPLVNAAG